MSDDCNSSQVPQRIAYYGGTFDPVHIGHLTIAKALIEMFNLSKLVFIPAFHAPHKVRLTPTPAYDRYAMLCLVTNDEPKLAVSRIEIESPMHPFSIDTLTKINLERPSDDVFFVMGADSWMDITSWREWEKVLSITNHIVVTRLGVEIGTSHVSEEIRGRIVDLRGQKAIAKQATNPLTEHRIYITDAVNLDISATKIRCKIRENDVTWCVDLPVGVAKYIQKYQIYN